MTSFTENEIKDVLTALYQDGHVDLVLADRVAALMGEPRSGVRGDPVEGTGTEEVRASKDSEPQALSPAPPVVVEAPPAAPRPEPPVGVSGAGAEVPLDAQEIARLILSEMLEAATDDGVAFDDEQRGFIEQALSDAAQEVINRSMAQLTAARQQVTALERERESLKQTAEVNHEMSHAWRRFTLALGGHPAGVNPEQAAAQWLRADAAEAQVAALQQHNLELARMVQMDTQRLHDAALRAESAAAQVAALQQERDEKHDTRFPIPHRLGDPLPRFVMTAEGMVRSDIGTWVPVEAAEAELARIAKGNGTSPPCENDEP